jgi:hypothetical protein
LDGTPVEVRVPRPDDLAAVKAAIQELKPLEGLPVEGWRLEGAVAEFEEECIARREATGAAATAAALHRLVERTVNLETERPRAARVVPELSTAEILTLRLPEDAEAPEGADDEDRFRLYRSWLVLAVVEGLLWVGPWAGNVHFLDGCPLFLGGRALPLDLDMDRDRDREQRWDLRDYLAATRRGEADLALGYLLRSSTRSPDALPVSRLRDRFRQAVAPATHRGRGLASLLAVHAHLLGTHGYRPPPFLRAWQRSLAELECLLEPTATEPPITDPLADAVDDARILGAAARGREIFGPRALRQTLLHNGPRWFENLERRAAGIDTEATPKAPNPSQDSGSEADAWVGFGALAVLLALVALLGERFGDLHPTVTPAMAVLFAALALYTLWFVLRSSSG